MIHGVGVGGTRRLKIGPVTSPTSPEALAPTPQKEHRPQSEPSHLLSLSWEHREVAPITPCSSRDRAGLCSPATLSGMWPDGPRCACHTRGPASVCTRRLQTGHHSSFQSQCPHAPHTTAETASNWTCAFIYIYIEARTECRSKDLRIKVKQTRSCTVPSAPVTGGKVL